MVVQQVGLRVYQVGLRFPSPTPPRPPSPQLLHRVVLPALLLARAVAGRAWDAAALQALAIGLLQPALGGSQRAENPGGGDRGGGRGTEGEGSGALAVAPKPRPTQHHGDTVSPSTPHAPYPPPAGACLGLGASLLLEAAYRGALPGLRGWTPAGPSHAQSALAGALASALGAPRASATPRAGVEGWGGVPGQMLGRAV